MKQSLFVEVEGRKTTQQNTKGITSHPRYFKYIYCNSATTTRSAYYYYFHDIDFKTRRALAGWLSWLECCPIHQNVVGSIPCLGTYMRQMIHGSGFSLTSMFLSLSPPIPRLKKNQ